MLAFLLPLASKIIKDAVAQIPENEELGEKMVEICLVILAKAVKLTKTDMDDQLLEVVTKAIRAREMGKTSEAAVYRKFINQMKEKTKKMNEEQDYSERDKIMKRANLSINTFIKIFIRRIPLVM